VKALKWRFEIVDIDDAILVNDERETNMLKTM
jgi:hypothetical protein